MKMQEGEIARIIKHVDLGGDKKQITFTEFLIAAANKQVLLAENNL